MKTKILPNLENKEIVCKSDNKPPMPCNLFQAYYRLSITGASGTGKSSAFINFFEKTYPYYDKVFVVSATLANDPKQTQAFVDREKVITFDEPSVELLKDIIEEIERLIEKHKEYLKTKKLMDKFVASDYDVDILRPNELMLLHSVNFDPSTMEMPVDREKLNILLFLDDLQGTKVLKSPKFENLIIKARHKQTNVALTTQSYKGVSAVWRRNVSALMIFKTIDKNQLESIFQEIQGLFKSKEQFYEIYEYATQEKHDFLYIDTQTKENPIRKNFNEVIMVDKFSKEE